MKRTLLIALFVALALHHAAAQSTMSFAQPRWDFGQIREQDGRVTHAFEFVNTGDIPFVIENVTVACGCTTPTFSKAPVLPGARGKITITFDPAFRPGRFSKEINIVSNSGRNYNTIYVEGVVSPRPLTVAEEFPVDMGNGVRFASTECLFRYVGQGTAKSMSLAYINDSQQTVRLEFRPSAPFKATPPVALKPSERGEATITCDLTSQILWGMVKQEIPVLLNGAKAKKTIYAQGIGTDDFPAVREPSADAPSANLSNQFHAFGRASMGATLRTSFTVSNKGKEPLTLRAVQPGEGVKCTAPKSRTIAPGKSAEFYVEWNTKGLPPGGNTASVVLIFNDPARPMREVRLSANME